MLCVWVLLAGADLAWTLLSPDHESVTIPCRATVVAGIQYRKISWYKVEGSDYHGLVLKNLHSNQTTVYRGADQSCAVDEDFSLLLPSNGLSDCGTYRCTLWPPLGEYIQEAQYQHYPPGCVRPTEAVTLMPVARAVEVKGHQLEVRGHVEWREWLALVTLLCIIVAVGNILIALYRRRQLHNKEKAILI